MPKLLILFALMILPTWASAAPVVVPAARNAAGAVVEVLPAQETVIMFETCELKTGQFPARHTPESRLYGVDFSRRLDGSEVIDVPDVSLMEGDIVISDVYNNNSVVTFRLTGGSPVYQRLAIRVTTTATPPNIYQGEATIACYP